MPVLPVSSMLSNIQQKVRRITGSPSLAQLTDNDLNQYINTAYTNDFPTTLKMFSLRTVLTFYTQPGIDVYKTNDIEGDPLNNFQNNYTAIHPPVYIAGVQAFFTQDRSVFYGNWPQTNFVQQTGLFGNGTAGPFVGVLPPPVNQPNNFFTAISHVLQNSVLITALDADGTAMNLIDYPFSNTMGALGSPGETLPTAGTVNYVTGEFSATFPSPTGISVPPQGNPIWSEAVYFVPGLPTTVLYYDNQFVLRPVPDKAYVVQVEANMVPTQFFNTTDNPLMNQWWQYIALLSAKKIFEDRRDYDSVNMIMPTLKEQESLVNSTNMEQYTNQRSITIYTNNGNSLGWNTWWNSWPY